MPSDKLKNQLHLHFIVFIWGFTAILGALISIDAMPLVWYRVLIAAITLFIYLKFKKIPLRENFSDYTKLTIGGVLIALHWTTFFYAIKISNISTTLITLSSSAVFLVLLQPFFGKKKFSLTHEDIIELRDKLIELTDYDLTQPITIPYIVPRIDARIDAYSF